MLSKINLNSDYDPLDDEGEYMNERQLHYFYTKLMDEKNSMLSKLSGNAKTLENSNDTIDAEDMAIKGDIQSKRLRDINEALKRIEEGIYGYCEYSGNEIGIARLKYLPTAKYSIATQEHFDSQNRQTSLRNNWLDD
ncbi:TraR/DksA family transcriptional regulator [Anaplasmataceae bacterium AB001_6]|nr:TraR/DksA family transcriptional regulator [Anaplasmataceae bacterium AB001_6]